MPTWLCCIFLSEMYYKKERAEHHVEEIIDVHMAVPVKRITHRNEQALDQFSAAKRENRTCHNKINGRHTYPIHTYQGNKTRQTEQRVTRLPL